MQFLDIKSLYSVFLSFSLFIFFNLIGPKTYGSSSNSLSCSEVIQMIEGLRRTNEDLILERRDNVLPMKSRISNSKGSSLDIVRSKPYGEDLNRIAFEIYLAKELNQFAKAFDIESFLGHLKMIENFSLEKKPLLQNVLVKEEVEIYPKTPVLQDTLHFLQLQFEKERLLISELFQNEDYWIKILGYKNRKDLENQLNEDVGPFLRKEFPESFRNWLKASDISILERAKGLYNIFLEKIENLEQLGKETQFARQAVLDLVRTIGYYEAQPLREALRSENPYSWLFAFKGLLEKRDQFAVQLGYENFDHLFNRFTISDSERNAFFDELPIQLKALEDEISNLSMETKVFRKKTVRHLSLKESLLRSCIGGIGTCSARFFSLALYSSYRHFVLTNEGGDFIGDMIVFLGEALSSKNIEEKVKVAFVDRIYVKGRNDFLIILEGVRMSVAAQGYTLVLSENLKGMTESLNLRPRRQGNLTRETMGIPWDREEVFEEFRPFFLSKYDPRDNQSFLQIFMDQHYRMSPILPLDLSEAGRIKMNLDSVDSINKFQETEYFDVKNYIQRTIQLKDSTSLVDQLEYIKIMTILVDKGIFIDPNFESKLNSWIEDKSRPLRLRKEALFYKWNTGASLLKFLQFFRFNDQKMLIHNFFIQTRNKITLSLKDRNFLLNFMMRLKRHRQLSLRVRLVELLFPFHHSQNVNQYRGVALNILREKDLSESTKLLILRKLIALFNSSTTSEREIHFKVIELVLREANLKNINLEDLTKALVN